MADTPRLPNPGGDDGQWGGLLNGFLEVSHDTDGSLLGAAVKAAGAVTSVNGKTPSNGAVTLVPSDIGSGDAASLQGAAIDPSTPSDGQALVYNSTASKWAPATITSSGSISDATTGSKGIVQLGGDLGGTASAPSVLKVKGVALPASAPTSGQVLTATSGSATAWSTPASAPVTSVAGKTGVVTLANTDITGLGSAATQNTSAFDAAGAATAAQAASLQKTSNLSDLASASTARTNLGLAAGATMSTTAGGDLSGTLPSPTVAKVNGIAVTGTPSANQVLTATGPAAASWSTPASGFADPTTTKGDLIVHGASTTRMPVGTNGQVLTADSAQTLGVKWATPSASSGGGYNVVTKSSSYTAANGDFIVFDSSGAGPFSVTLPAPTAGAYVRVKKKGTDGNTISVLPPSGQIDGSNSVSVNGQYQSQDFMADGTSWYQV